MGKNYFVSPILESIRNSNIDENLELAHHLSAEYIKHVDKMRAYPDAEAISKLSVFHEELAELPEKTEDILNKLH